MDGDAIGVYTKAIFKTRIGRLILAYRSRPVELVGLCACRRIGLQRNGDASFRKFAFGDQHSQCVVRSRIDVTQSAGKNPEQHCQRKSENRESDQHLDERVALHFSIAMHGQPPRWPSGQ